MTQEQRAMVIWGILLNIPVDVIAQQVGIPIKQVEDVVYGEVH